ncbi:MAG: UrcA family protein [Parvularculaceae bacterium]|nr:UrcA family protein [Parvularculaceae bacterium]
MSLRRFSVPLAAVLMAAATPSFAADELAFRFDRSELATPAGAARVHAKMVEAASRACTSKPIGSRIARLDVACKQRLLDDWVRAAGDERLERAQDRI